MRYETLRKKHPHVRGEDNRRIRMSIGDKDE